jgi:hypothetical protein
MTVNLDVLRQHRDALLLAEVAAWLHNIGKLEPNFVGSAPKELLIEGYRYQRFASPDPTQISDPDLQILFQQNLDDDKFRQQVQTWINNRNAPQELEKALVTLYEFTKRHGPLYFAECARRVEILKQQKPALLDKYVDEQISQHIQAWKQKYPGGWEQLCKRKRSEYRQQRQQELEQEWKSLLKQEEQDERDREQKWHSLELALPQLRIKWSLADLLTLFWDDFFAKDDRPQHDPGSDNDPDYSRTYLLQNVFPVEPSLPALLVLSHGEISGQEKKGITIGDRYCERDEDPQHGRIENLQSYSLANLLLSTAFGYEPDKALNWFEWPQKRLSIIEKVPAVWRNPVSERGNFLRVLAEGIAESISDARLPFNEISLLDYVQPIAALFKTAVARAVITGQMPTPADMHWRLVSVRLDALDFLSHSHQIADLIARRQLLSDAYRVIQHLLEVEIPIGACVYADENGLVFVLPEIPGWSDSEIQEALSAQIYNALDAPQSMETATFPALYGAADLRPSVQVGPARRGKKLQLQEVLHQEAPLSMPNPDEVQKWWQGATGERCVICGLRPQGYIEPGLPKFVTEPKARERHLCGTCLARRGRRAEEWAGRPDETIWIDEVADVNGRIALIVGRFDLDHWIDGTLVRSLAIGTDQNGNWLAKPPTFARIQRVWRTTAEFWESVQSETIQQLKDDRRRLCLWLNGQPDLGHYHTYELNLGLTTLSVVWVPPRDGQEWYLISADNLQYVAKQLGAEESIYKHAASSCIFVEDVIQRELVQKNREPELQNPESLPSERGKNLLKGYRLKSTDHQDVAYSTAIPILAEPRTFMALVPADRALEVVKAIKSKYEREMGKVRNRLPLTLGVVYFGRRVPLAAALDAGRRMLQRPAIEVMCKVKNVEPPNCTDQNWPRERRITLELNEQEITLSVPTVMGDGQTHDVWYPYWRVEGRPTNRTRWFIGPDSEHWVHICDLEPGDQVSFLPSTFDYEFLDTTTRRFEVSYDASGQRRSQDRRQRPYLLEELDKLEKAWKDISHLSKSQIHAVIAAMETKRHVWEKPVGAGALALPDQDVFRQFVRDTLRESGVWSEPLERAALNGMLRDALEIHLEIMKEELK